MAASAGANSASAGANFSRRSAQPPPMFEEVTLTGTPYARGKTYGQRVPGRINHSIATYARLFAYRRGMDWAACQEAALAFEPVLQAGASDVLEEMRGIADGSGKQLSEIMALNVRTELLAGKAPGDVHPKWQEALFANSAAGVPAHAEDGGELLGGAGGFSRERARANGFGAADGGGFASAALADFGECTSAAADKSVTTMGATILAQTWDWQGDQRAACVVLRIYSPDHPEILTLTEAGMVAKHGINSEGLAVGLNMMHSKTDGQGVGMPVHVLLRKMLQARTFAEAKAIPRAHPAVASSCIVLASARGELSALEITPAGVAEVPAKNGRLVHTNHALDAGAAADECDIKPSNTSRDRHQRASEMLQGGSGDKRKLHLDDFKAILRDHKGEPRCICRHPDRRIAAVDRSETVCGVIMDLGTMGLHIAPGLPCFCEYETMLIDFPLPNNSGSGAVIADSCSLCVPI